MTSKTLQAFTEAEFDVARKLLAARVSTMLGRKMEEADWDFVYCHAKMIPGTDWSNLHIDVNHRGLGVEHKMLRITRSGSILQECGTTKMHPAGTRSIRIPNEFDADLAAANILAQYSELIETRANAVRESNDGKAADMRIGWLLWKDGLDEFLYFEVEMVKPRISDYYAEWNVTPARGARKESRSLWIYEKETGKKKYSVTTDAGVKIQPYFDVPPPSDKNLYHFKVQGVLVDGGLVEVWLTKSTAKYLELLYGALDAKTLSNAILAFNPEARTEAAKEFFVGEDIAVPVRISVRAYKRLWQIFSANSDEDLLQQFALNSGAISK